MDTNSCWARSFNGGKCGFWTEGITVLKRTEVSSQSYKSLSRMGNCVLDSNLLLILTVSLKPVLKCLSNTQRANLPSSSVFPSLLLSLTEETQRYTSYRQEIPPCKSLPGLPLSVSSSSLHTKRTCTLSSYPLHSPLSSVTFPMYGEEGRWGVAECSSQSETLHTGWQLCHEGEEVLSWPVLLSGLRIVFNTSS